MNSTRGERRNIKQNEHKRGKEREIGISECQFQPIIVQNGSMLF